MVTEPHWRFASPRMPAASAQVLTRVITALDREHVRHCLLRSVDDGPGLRDVDLLVHPHDLGRFETTVGELGFVPLPSWGTGGHRPHVAFEAASGEWLNLDVVTSLRFGGRPRPLKTAVL